VHLLVVDPLLLLRAFEHPRSTPAGLLSLLMYGQVCLDARGQPLEEASDLALQFGHVVKAEQLANVRAELECAQKMAMARKELMEKAFEQDPASDLLLVSSSPMRNELRELARASQGAGNNHVRPDVVVRLLARWSARVVFDLPPAPFYLGANRLSEREYLIHTAIVGEAQSLVTDDPALLLPGDASHSDPRTRRSVRPYSLEEFLGDVLHHTFDFDEIDLVAVYRSAVRPIRPEC